MASQCKQCGAEVLTTQRFCRFCGAPTGLVSTEETETQRIPAPTEPRAPAPTQPAYIAPEPPVPYTTARMESPPKHRWRWVIGVLLGLVVLGLALVGYSVYKMSQKPRIYVLAPTGQETPGPDEAPALTGPSVEAPTPPTPPAPPRAPQPPPPPPSLGETPAPAHPEALEKPPQRISSRQLYANAIRRVAPEYPPLARRLRVIPPVEVEVVVDENGDVSSAEVISGPAPLHQAVLDAARQWKFQPFVQDGEPISVTGVLVFGERVKMFNRLLRER